MHFICIYVVVFLLSFLQIELVLRLMYFGDQSMVYSEIYCSSYMLHCFYFLTESVVLLVVVLERYRQIYNSWVAWRLIEHYSLQFNDRWLELSLHYCLAIADP